MRTLASLAAALVLILTILAASPELHERLHGLGPGAAKAAPHDGRPSGDGRAGDDEDGCIVNLFAQGLVLPLALLTLAFTGRTLRLDRFDLHDSVFPATPRFLHLPSQAPPAGLS